MVIKPYTKLTINSLFSLNAFCLSAKNYHKQTEAKTRAMIDKSNTFEINNYILSK